MPTTFSLLCDRCGLSLSEAARWLDVRLDTAKSWSSGRNPAPDGVIDELKGLYGLIDETAVRALKSLPKEALKADEIEIGIASTDLEAQALGLPCVGAHGAVLGLVAAKIKGRVAIVPRGSTLASNAAVLAHEGKIKKL